MPLLPFSPRVIRRPSVRKPRFQLNNPQRLARFRAERTVPANTLPGKGVQSPTSRMASPMKAPTLRQPRGRRS
jgi:hypothetical protein